MSPDAKPSPGRGRRSQDSRGGRLSESQVTADLPRPPLGPSAEDHARHLAAAQAAIAAAGRAQRAVRLLEVVTAAPLCPAIRTPRYLAGQLRALADELDQERAA